MEVIAGAIIGLLAGLIAALIVAWQQRDSTRTLIAAEFEKLNLQAKSHTRHRKEEWVLQAVPALLAASDPELHASFNYTEVVTLIHKIQVILIPREPLEWTVNDAASKLGFAVQAAKCGQSEPGPLLAAQDTLIRATRALLDAP